MDSFSVIGYDKDYDVYVCYGCFQKEEDAVSCARRLNGSLLEGKLFRICSDGTKEPIDWIEVYKNMDKENEQIVWRSYGQEGLSS